VAVKIAWMPLNCADTPRFCLEAWIAAVIVLGIKLCRRD